MIGSQIRRFLAAWREEDRATKAFLLWDAGNTVVAVALLVGAFALLVAASAPGFQRTPLLGYIAVAVGWLISIFVIGPVYNRVGPAES